MSTKEDEIHFDTPKIPEIGISRIDNGVANLSEISNGARNDDRIMYTAHLSRVLEELTKRFKFF